MSNAFRIPPIALALGLALPCAAVGIFDRSFGVEQPAGRIADAIEFQGELYVGGDFLVAGRRNTPYVAKFVDGRWVKPLGDPPGEVERFVEHEGTLYIVGNARDPQNRRKGFVASYDGQNWKQIGGRFTNALYTLAHFDDSLFAAGKGVFRWDGATWQQESGLTTSGQIRWLAPHADELYAGHWTLGLFHRNGASWERWPWSFTSPDCSQPGSASGDPRAVVVRPSGLWILGDLGGVKELDGPGSLDSRAVIAFDGSAFQSVTTPWQQGCDGSSEVDSQIYDAVALDDAVVTIGSFSEEFVPGQAQFALTVHRDDDWSDRRQLALYGAMPRVSKAGSTAVVMGATSYQLRKDSLSALGRMSLLDPLTLEFAQLYEQEAYGQLGYWGELQPVPALATHFGSVVVGGSGVPPAGASLPLLEGVLQAFDANGRRLFWLPRPMRPTALLSSADGLYVADHQLLLRSDGRDQGEILVSGLNAPVRAMAEFADELIFGGEFTTVDGASVRRLARLDGAGAVQPMGDPDGPVLALAYFQGDLIAAGQFTQIGGIDAASVARWDGSEWSPMGDGFDRSLRVPGMGRVEALWEYQGTLYAAGDLRGSGPNLDIFYIARWDGAAWVALSPIDLNSPARCLVEHDGLLFVGGDFTFAGNVSARHLAAFDGEAWQVFGADANASILSMASMDGDLYLGGEFTMLDGFHSFGLGRWRAEARPTPEQPPAFFSFPKVVPNPFNPRTEIVLRLPASGPVELDIFDSRGRLLRSIRRPYMLAGEARIEWDGFDESGDDVASGSYYFRARFAGKSLTRTATLLR